MKINFKHSDGTELGGKFSNVEVLFVVNNEDGKNHSILGVYDTPELAFESVKQQAKIIREANEKYGRDYDVPHMTLKAVIKNLGAYEGCRYGISENYLDSLLTVEHLETNYNFIWAIDKYITSV